MVALGLVEISAWAVPFARLPALAGFRGPRRVRDAQAGNGVTFYYAFFFC